MYRSAISLCILLSTVSSYPAYAQVRPAEIVSPLEVTAEGIDGEGYIEEAYAFCVPDDTGARVKEGGNKSIGLSWTPGPQGTQSYAVIAVDKDVPTVFDDANQEGKTIAASLPRQPFYHWILYNIPAGTLSLAAGLDSQSIEKRGKSVLNMPYGTRGVNDYAGYFASTPERSGIYAGYDGPCPPWNDERVHHYHFQVYALGVPRLELQGKITGSQLLEVMKPHMLARGEVVGKYTLNSALPAQPVSQ